MQHQEEMSLFKARSFYMVMASIIIGMLHQNGFTLPLANEEVAQLLMELVPIILMGWAYVERFFGKKKLKVRMSK